ncbi:MAG: 3-phosphoshikimate 1-carboxyvinyltransferase [Patescibacteria group bacterium]
MKFIVKSTTQFSGTVQPPSSKSHSVRGLLLATLANGTSHLQNVLRCDVTDAAIDVCRGLGATLEIMENKLQGYDIAIRSNGVPFSSSANRIFTYNSGITTRFVLPMVGLRKDVNQSIVLDCGEQMRQRPIQPLVEILRKLGLSIQYSSNSVYPLVVTGQLQGGDAVVDGVTSQFISALLVSLPLAPLGSVIRVHELNERPYMDMTLSWLDEAGIRYEHRQDRGYDVFKISGRQRYLPFTKTIPGDFSSASYIIAAAVLLPGKVKLHGLDMDDPQGDKRLIPILQSMGAQIEVKEGTIEIVGGAPLTAATIDCNDIPDLLPTLAVVATQARGVTHLTNVPQVRLKETDRLYSMFDGLTRLGARVEEQADGLIIYESTLHGATLSGYKDHRTVMALSVAGMLATGETTIDTAEAINKTFPNYVGVMNGLGAHFTSV